MASPEKQPQKEPQSRRHSGTRSFPETSTDRYRSDFWQEHIEQWVKQEHLGKSSKSGGKRRVTSAKTGSKSLNTFRNIRRQPLSQYADNTLNSEFVHYPGFQGSQESQANNLKYKFGIKKPGDEPQQPSTFRPKGFGMLYDEVEFERRYKKVFDVNNHVHFVNSNFISGQRIFKRNKLPPIGHIPSMHSEDSDTKDIFAIMSVQRFNHPRDNKPSCPPASPTEESENHCNHLDSKECEQNNAHIACVPDGFIPRKSPSKSSGNSTCMTTNQNNSFARESSYRLSLASHGEDSAFGTLTEETSPAAHREDGPPSDRSSRNKKAKSVEEPMSRKGSRGKVRQKEKENIVPPETPEEELRPFNISVHVNIRPKDQCINGGDDEYIERANDEQLLLREQSNPPEATPLKIEAETDETDSVRKPTYPTIIEGNESENEASGTEGLKSASSSSSNCWAETLAKSHRDCPDIFLQEEVTENGAQRMGNVVNNIKVTARSTAENDVQNTGTTIHSYKVKPVPGIAL